MPDISVNWHLTVEQKAILDRINTLHLVYNKDESVAVLVQPHDLFYFYDLDIVCQYLDLNDRKVRAIANDEGSQVYKLYYYNDLTMNFEYDYQIVGN